VSIEDVRRHRTQPVQMVLGDGLTMVVEIVDALDDQDRDQVSYKVLSVISAGATARPQLEAGKYYSTDLKEIVDLRAVAGRGQP
jgi:hypothetical protein